MPWIFWLAEAVPIIIIVFTMTIQRLWVLGFLSGGITVERSEYWTATRRHFNLRLYVILGVCTQVRSKLQELNKIQWRSTKKSNKFQIQSCHPQTKGALHVSSRNHTELGIRIFAWTAAERTSPGDWQRRAVEGLVLNCRTRHWASRDTCSPPLVTHPILNYVSIKFQ